MIDSDDIPMNYKSDPLTASRYGYMPPGEPYDESDDELLGDIDMSNQYPGMH